MSNKLSIRQLKRYSLYTFISLLGLGVVSGVVYGVSQIKISEPKTICVQSHTDSHMEYGYGYSIMNGKIGYGWHLATTDICDKEAPNPKYTGKP